MAAAPDYFPRPLSCRGLFCGSSRRCCVSLSSACGPGTPRQLRRAHGLADSLLVASFTQRSSDLGSCGCPGDVDLPASCPVVTGVPSFISTRVVSRSSRLRTTSLVCTAWWSWSARCRSGRNGLRRSFGAVAWPRITAHGRPCGFELLESSAQAAHAADDTARDAALASESGRPTSR